MIALAAATLASGCLTVPAGEGALAGACAGLEPRIVAHAGALADLPAGPAEDAAVATGEALIVGIDAACGGGDA